MSNFLRHDEFFQVARAASESSLLARGRFVDRFRLRSGVRRRCARGGLRVFALVLSWVIAWALSSGWF